MNSPKTIYYQCKYCRKVYPIEDDHDDPIPVSLEEATALVLAGCVSPCPLGGTESCSDCVLFSSTTDAPITPRTRTPS